MSDPGEQSTSAIGSEQPPPSPARRAADPGTGHALNAAPAHVHHEDHHIDLERRRDELQARVAELQWDLGGLVYEMATRDRIRVDVIVKRAAVLQDADAELAEVERILRMEQTSTAGTCKTCGAPHSRGAAYCWQCGSPILRQVDTSSIIAP
jgi:hypothetical protein